MAPTFPPHFTAAEMGYDTTPAAYQGNVVRLAGLLEQLRGIAGGPMIVSSVYRTPEHNEAVGGAANSDHLTGSAADFDPPGSPEAWLAQLRAGGAAVPRFGQLEIDPTDGHVHVSLPAGDSSDGEVLLALGGGGYQALERFIFAGGGLAGVALVALAVWAFKQRRRG